MFVPAADFLGIMPWLLTNGASTMNATWTQATVDAPRAVEAVAFMRSLVAKGISPRPGGTFDPFVAATQGKLAMFGHGRLPLVTMRRLHFVDQMAIAAWPHKVAKGSPVGWQGYPIMKASPNKEAAWAFVKFIVSKKACEYFAKIGGTVTPPRRSVVQSQAYLADSPRGSEKWYQALDYATPLPSPNKGNIVETDIINALSQVLAGNADVAQALKQLNGQIQASL
jgi:multiple sugar transport system substrate-binding protein